MFDFITDHSFDIDKTKQYILSIQVSLDGFSFLVVHASEKKIVAAKSTQLKISSENLLARRLKEWFDSEELLKRPFYKLRLFIFAENFTIIPEEYHSEEYLQNLAPVLLDNEPNFTLIENRIEPLNARLFFTVHPEIIELIQLYHKNAEYFHPVTKFLQTPLQSNKKNSAVIISTKRNFFLIIKRNNKLLLANSFPVVHQNDLVYYVLNSFQQLETARSETDLFIADVISDNLKIKSLLLPYFENISPLKTGELAVNPDIFEHQLLLYLAQN